MFLGFVLAHILCNGDFDCQATPVDTQIYSTRNDCEWALHQQENFYNDLQCVEAKGQ